MKKPYEIIGIDKNTKRIKIPDLLLMNRAFDIIGKIPKYTNWNLSLAANGLDEISFEVHKYNNGVICPVWDDLIDLKIVDVRTFGRFEISVDYTDNTETVKSIHGVSLETELGQIPLYEFHVNDEDAADMIITEYSKSDYDKKGDFIPTVFFNKNDIKHSLLHRVLADKAPHWSIGTVPDFIILENQKPEPVETFQRTYTCDGESIYDFLTGTVAEESNVVFIFDTINREINCYNLCEYNVTDFSVTNCISLNEEQHSDYIKCGDTLEITELSLPDTSSIICNTYDENQQQLNTVNITTNTTLNTSTISYVRFFYSHSVDLTATLTYKIIYKQGTILGNCIGEDTNVLISKRKLANEITITSNKDSLKNCFRIEGGDDIISNYVRAVNLNGSNYIYQFADFQLNDMPNELVDKIKSYNEKIETHREKYYGTQGISDFVTGVTGIKVQTFEDYNLILILLKNFKFNADIIFPYTKYAEEYPISSYWYVVENKLKISNSYDTIISQCDTIITVNELFKSLGIFTRLCEKYDELLYYESEMMPNVEIEDTDAETEYKNMAKELNMMTIGVSSLNNYDENSFLRITNNVEAMAQILVDSRYKVEVIEDTASYNNDTKKWTGKFKITRITDETDYYPKTTENTNSISISIDDDELLFANQKIQKALSKGSMLDIDFNVKEIWGDEKKLVTNTITLNPADFSNCIKCDGYFEISDISNSNNGFITCETYDWKGNIIKSINQIKNPIVIDTTNASYVKLFYTHNQGSAQITYVSQEPNLPKVRDYFSLYSLNRLKSFFDSYNTCLSNLVTMGNTTTSDILNELYYDYYWRLSTVEEVYKQRQQEVDKIKSDIKTIEMEQKDFQDDLNFQMHLKNNNLYETFCSYRREDTYKNDNYISDGLSGSECLEKAKELVDAANVEIKKSCVLQRTVSTSLNNLLLLPEFESLYDKLALFNYIRIRTEDEILKLRLIGLDFNGESAENINVTFAEQIESVDGKLSDLQSIIQQASSIASSYSSTTLQAKQGANANNIVSEMYNSGLNAAQTRLSNNDSNEVTITSAGILCKRMDDEGYYGEKQLRITGNIMAFTRDNWQSVEMAIGETQFKNPITNESKTAYGIIAENLVGKFIAGENAYIGNEKGNVLINGDGITIYKGKELNDNNRVFYTEDGDLWLKGKIEAEGGYFKGQIQSSEGDIGGWNISNKGLRYNKSDTEFLALYSTSQSLVTQRGITKATLTSGYLQFSCSNQPCATLHATTWKPTPSVYGVGINSEANSKFISFGNKKNENDTEYNTSFLLNYGLNPDKNTQDVLIYGTSKFFSDSYFNSSIHLGSTSLSPLSSSTGAGIYCSNAIYIASNLGSNDTRPYCSLYTNGRIYATGAICPEQDDNSSLGTSHLRYTNLYATGKITTSDKNEKNIIGDISEVYKKAFMELKPIIYTYKNFNSNGHQHDRKHCGFIAQDVKQTFDKYGITSNDFALVCKDTFDNTLPNGTNERYGLKYEELHGLEVFMIQKLSNKISLLETKLNKLENIIKI